ncbi:tyrosine-type recombinase/integrase [Streptomyces chartreusis]|uniref:tyrosine-type recombinase/integrase n=1 Tax=Streptomyces chartreusis TaxID=1969 RepID=UPI002E81F93E|nr:tyrosine-type recombinase/integrase [Streptomyces chartreusis]WUB23205.1 site-specific integrase [Streptomyces chartreusis]
MLQGDLSERDLTGFVLPEIGRLQETGERWMPYRLLGSGGAVVEPVQVFFTELQAEEKPASTIRSYGMDLLRWWRFLSVFDLEWNRVTRADARDFTRWMQIANKPERLHWRHRQAGYTAETAPKTVRKKVPGTPNAITGKASPGPQYAARTRAHCETVLRTFYDFHLAEGTGPIINPFPLHRFRGSGRANAHHQPGRPFQRERAGRYRPTIPKRAPRRIPDEMFNALFAALRYHRDRALLALWVSNAARAEELLTSRQRDALPGQQLLGVVRKGTRAYQQLPCSTDAFVWLRLYQEENRRAGVPRGGSLPLWWTLRRPWRPLQYDAARAMFNRANDLLGSNWTLHDLRHTAAYRMARDPKVSLTDVQWVLAHAHLSTTQIYLKPRELHQAGENSQVTWSQWESEGVRSLYELAS